MSVISIVKSRKQNQLRVVGSNTAQGATKNIFGLGGNGISLRKIHFYRNCCLCLFLVRYVEERPWWPIECPSKERRQANKREIRSNLLIFYFKVGKLQDSGKKEEGKTFRKLHALGMDDDLWDRVRGVLNIARQ